MHVLAQYRDPKGVVLVLLDGALAVMRRRLVVDLFTERLTIGVELGEGAAKLLFEQEIYFRISPDGKTLLVRCDNYHDWLSRGILCIKLPKNFLGIVDDTRTHELRVFDPPRQKLDPVVDWPERRRRPRGSKKKTD